jgi:SAM-dependent methyltransferase
MNSKTHQFDYDRFGQHYSHVRTTDPRIATYVHEALSGAQTVLNVGAGSGSYEPGDKYVVAVEPSRIMRGQRRKLGKVPAVNGTAEQLPFDDRAFDASMAVATVHHWQDMKKGLRELRRVTRNQVIILTFDPNALDRFWNRDYFPELIEVEKSRYPAIRLITETLGTRCEVQEIPIPLDCTDGFQEAFYGRPEAFLNKEVRLSQSAWGFLTEDVEARLVKTLADDLESGEWDRRYGHYRTQPTLSGSLRLIISKP